MTGPQIIQVLLKKIQQAIDEFQESIPGIQKDIYAEMVNLAKGLDMKDDRLAVTVKNVKAIGRLRADLEKTILSEPYLDKVHDFAQAFNSVAALQNAYFKTIATEYTPPKVLDAVKTQAIDATIEGLTEAGIHFSVTEGIQDILRTNITTGGNFPDLLSQMKDFIIGTKAVPGSLLRYTKQLTTDSLNQYSAQYNQVVTDDLGLEWFQYVGSIIATSRPLCQALISKKWVNKSEIPDIITGDFPEFKEKGGKLDKHTGLPAGMIPGTTKYNFPIYRGGYNCGHQLIPVSAIVVPESVKLAIK